MSTSLGTEGIDIAAPQVKQGRSPRKQSLYPFWFYIPAGVIYTVLFLIPTVVAFYFSLTRWNLTTSTFIGLDNFKQFFNEPALVMGLRNTLIYAVVTSGAKVVLGMLLALLLTSKIIGRGYLRSVTFFPVLVSTIGVGITFVILMNPTKGLINNVLGFFGINGPGWLTNPNLALLSVAGVDIWKGVGIATLIFIAGIVAIPEEYYEAARLDGASSTQIFRKLIIPLSWPATSTVITLSLIGGLRSFDLIWAMTKGGPGFSSDVIASVIYKQYQAGFFGLSTAGNVVLFLLVTIIILPLTWWLNRKEAEL
jgi:raffinose/stachyose/melibiose transport system permease protein